MSGFRIPSIPSTTNKTIRFPNDLLDDIEEVIVGKNCTFSAFVIAAMRMALTVTEVINMKCENYFCIYWKNNNCILDNISLDIQGRCENCIYIDIDEMTLQNRRKDMLELFEKRYKYQEKKTIHNE